MSGVLEHVCSEKRRADKKLGLEFLKHGELGGTGGLGSFAGLFLRILETRQFF